MPQFNYVALDSRGQESTGFVEAVSTSDAIAQLRQAGYFPTGVCEEGVAPEKKSRRSAKTVRAAPRTKRKGTILFQKRTVKAKTLMVFTRQLATLIDAGLPLLRGLNVLAKQERDVLLKNTINQVADSVQGGSTFSESLALHPKIFNKLFVSMVKAGELGGVLELVLGRLAEFQEKAQKVKNKVKSAMIYPVIVLSLAMIIMAFLFVFIVPKFAAIFHDMLGDKPLPAITQFVIGISGFMQHHWLVLIGAIVALIAGCKFVARTPTGAWSSTGSRCAHPSLVT
jgi:type IV pilus assembly protein PilC